MTDGLRFLLDEQLGKLARWLRIIGQDAAYQREIPDAQLLERAAAEGRVILTRDHRLSARARALSFADRVTIVVLTENYPALQLREVFQMYRERIQVAVFSRCPVCNAATAPEDKNRVEAEVPPFVFTTQTEFTRCPECRRVYWQATHRSRVALALKDILGLTIEE